MATKRKAGRKKKQQQAAGWVWLMVGLSIGLTIAAGIYMKDRTNAAALVEKNKEAPLKGVPETPELAADSVSDEYDFYKWLQEQNYRVPDEDFRGKPKPPPQSIEDPGSYVLQVMSFSTNADADGLKARLALSGIVAHIQEVDVDGKAIHRVLIGPMSDLSNVNRTLSQLIALEFAPLPMKVSD